MICTLKKCWIINLNNLNRHKLHPESTQLDSNPQPAVRQLCIKNVLIQCHQHCSPGWYFLANKNKTYFFSALSHATKSLLLWHTGPFFGAQEWNIRILSLCRQNLWLLSLLLSFQVKSWPLKTCPRWQMRHEYWDGVILWWLNINWASVDTWHLEDVEVAIEACVAKQSS